MAGGRIGLGVGGRSDFFGPLVIAAVYLTSAQESQLSGLKRGNKLKDEDCLALDQSIRETCTTTIVAIGPAKFNELFGKIRHTNTIIAWAHARAIDGLYEKGVDENHVVTDRFADPDGLVRHFGENGREITLSTDSDMAFQAADVVARAEFMRRLSALGEKQGIRLPKGANLAAAEAGAEIVRKLGKDSLREVAKLNFRTLQDVLRKSREPCPNSGSEPTSKP